MKSLLVTGGAGFIGSNFVRYFLDAHPGVRLVNFDELTYAGNLENLAGLQDRKEYTFIRGGLCVRTTPASDIESRSIDAIVHFAAESHVSA
jgi:dTDP-glucose 4,6-dehydratase